MTRVARLAETLRNCLLGATTAGAARIAVAAAARKPISGKSDLLHLALDAVIALLRPGRATVSESCHVAR